MFERIWALSERTLWVLFFVGGLCTIAHAQGVSQDAKAKALYEEAQKYHLGIDRPVDYRRAFELYLEAVNRDPQFKDAYYNMAHICFAQKRYDLAAQYYRRVIALDPNDADAQNNLGTVYQLQGNLDAAKAQFLRALNINHDLATSYYNLAVLLLKEGDKDNAEKAVERAMRLDPDNPDYVRLSAGIKGQSAGMSNWAILAVAGAFGGIIAGYYLLFGRRGA